MDADWASSLAAEVISIFAADANHGAAQLFSATAVSPDLVEIVYSDSSDTGVRGIAIDMESVRSARWRIRESSISELAFSLVHAGIVEPRRPEDFLPPDEHGVTWLPISRWLDDVS